MKNYLFIFLLLPGILYSQTIQQLDLPAGATDLIDPPYKRFQHLIEEGNIATRKTITHWDRTELNIDYSFSGEVISTEVDIDGVRIEQAYVNYSLGNGLTIVGGRILQMDESLQDAEEFFNEEGPMLEDYKINLNNGELLSPTGEFPEQLERDEAIDWLGNKRMVRPAPSLSPLLW